MCIITEPHIHMLKEAHCVSRISPMHLTILISFFITCRYLYERAIVTRDYGVLMTQWDNREESGRNMIRDADMIFDMLPKMGKTNMMPSSMTLLPVDLHDGGGGGV